VVPDPEQRNHRAIKSVISIGRWLLSTLIIMWLAATLAFIGLHIIPGSTLEAQLLQAGVDETVIKEREEALGLNLPVPIQYEQYMISLLHGNLGYSLISGQPVSDLIMDQLSPTLWLALPAWVLSSVFGLAIGIIGGIETYPRLRQIAQMATALILSIPIYWSGTLLIFVSGNLLSVSSGFPNWLLPTILLGLHTSGATARIVQSSTRLIYRMDFVRTARAKGLPEKSIIWRHILRVSLIPAVPVIGLQFGFLLGGTVVTESLFARPGLGQLLLNSTLQQDYPVVQGLVILSAGIYALINGAATTASQWLDPRIRP
jgi:ABC-type dipeptide/oligopeptide/nickel transport system permease component